MRPSGPRAEGVDRTTLAPRAASKITRSRMFALALVVSNVRYELRAAWQRYHLVLRYLCRLASSPRIASSKTCRLASPRLVASAHRLARILASLRLDVAIVARAAPLHGLCGAMTPERQQILWCFSTPCSSACDLRRSENIPAMCCQSVMYRSMAPSARVRRVPAACVRNVGAMRSITEE